MHAWANLQGCGQQAEQRLELRTQRLHFPKMDWMRSVTIFQWRSTFEDRSSETSLVGPCATRIQVSGGYNLAFLPTQPGPLF